MKKSIHFLSFLFITIIISFLLSSNLNAQIPTTTWAKSAGGTSSDDGRGISHDAAGNIYVTGGFNGTAAFGSTTLTSSGGREMFLAKYNPAGNVIWAISGGTSGSDRGTAIATDANGNSYVTGYFDGFSGACTFGTQSAGTTSNTYEIFVAKFDSAGTCLWVTAVDGNDDEDWPEDIALDANGNSYITGYYAGTANFGTATINSGGTGSAATNSFIAKYNDLGVHQWVKNAGGNHRDVGYGVDVDATGNVYATGYFRNTASFGSFTLVSNGTNIQDMYLVKYNALGVEQWAVKGGGSSSDIGKSVKVDGNGDLILTGAFSGTATFGTTNITSTNSSFDMFVAKYTATGTLSWISQAGGVDDNIPNQIAFDSNNKIYVFGTMTNDMLFGTMPLPNSAPGFAYDDPFLAGYDVNGNFLFAKNGGDGYSDLGYGMTIDDSDNIYLTGRFDEDCCGAPGAFDGVAIAGAADANGDDVFMVKLSPQNNILYTKTDVDCNGFFTGVIDITPSFGAAPYSYTWTGPNGFTDTTQDLSNIEGGTYYITITDGSSSTASDSIAILNPPLLVLTAGQNFPATTCSSNDGGAHIIVTGGTELTSGGSPYHYLWSDPATQTSQLAQQLYPGPIQIIVTDENGCMDSLTIIVAPYLSENDILSCTLTNQTGPANIDTTNHTVTIEVSAGTGLSNLSPTITFSDCASMNPLSGAIQDFSFGTVPYTVTAMDGTVQIWLVSVSEQPTGINSNLNLNESVLLYPNPMDKLLTIELDNHSSSQITIMTSNGKVVYNNVDLRHTNHLINTSEWSSGLYLIKIVDKNTIKTYKILKQ